ncbi:helix-turn-helix domain-containing protein [Vibrio owensii]|uniref:helix-turn-helix domain-containing protein n=1 Tax=Vibrio owensii TaxID=696485 RepID=UPI0005EE5CB0|nr:helix-turn-helix transcriptional regulator [Vibrio owensii]
MFGKQLLNYRKEKKLTQKEFILFLSCSKESFLERLDIVSYSRWESGKVIPPLRKQAIILNLIERSYFIKEISKGKEEKIKSIFNTYMLERYDSFKSLDLFYLKKENIRHFNVTTLSEYPCNLLEIQKKIFQQKKPELFLDTIINTSKKSSYSTYCNMESSYCGHLSYAVTSVEEFNINFVPFISREVEGDILYIFCGYAGTKSIFLHQLKTLIDEMYNWPNISQFYVRTYDDKFCSILREHFDGKTVDFGAICTKGVRFSGNRYRWVGLLCDATLLRLSYAGIESLIAEYGMVNTIQTKCC